MYIYARSLDWVRGSGTWYFHCSDFVIPPMAVKHTYYILCCCFFTSIIFQHSSPALCSPSQNWPCSGYDNRLSLYYHLPVDQYIGSQVLFIRARGCDTHGEIRHTCWGRRAGKTIQHSAITAYKSAPSLAIKPTPHVAWPRPRCTFVCVVASFSWFLTEREIEHTKTPSFLGAVGGTFHQLRRSQPGILLCNQEPSL